MLRNEIRNDEEAYDLYLSNAFKHEFGIRKDNLKKRENTNIVRQRIFVCSCEDFIDIENNKTTKKFDVANECTGCKASIQFDVAKTMSVYIVTKYDMIYNHRMLTSGSRQLIKSHRKVTNEQITINYVE